MIRQNLVNIFVLVFVFFVWQSSHCQTLDNTEDLSSGVEARNFTELPMFPTYRDYFSQLSTYGFSFLRFRERGFDAVYSTERFEGVQIRDFWRDTPYWDVYSGLSSYVLTTTGYRGSLYNPASVGIGSFASIQESYVDNPNDRRFRMSYSFSNRTFTNRATALYNSGLLKGGWSVSAEVTYRGGRSLSIDGVWADGWMAMASVNKKFKDNKNALQLLVMAAPMSRANGMAVTDEVTQLTSNNLYNPNWGYQVGKERASRVRSSLLPVGLLSHTWKINTKSQLFTSAFVSYGRSGYMALNWQTAPNPNPDYYRYLPSFERSPQAAQELTDLWRTDQRVSQIDFQGLYDYNALSPQAHYIQENRVRETFMTGGQTTYNLELEHTSLSATAEVYYTHENRYKTLEDLMGASYWLDVDYFAGQDEDFRFMTQNNMASPNGQVVVGDKFGYYYSLDHLRGLLSLSAQHRLENWKFTVGANAGVQSLSRRGHWEKQLYASEQSLGDSPKQTSMEYLVKAGVEYNLGRKLNVLLFGMVHSRVPTAQNSFIDANYRNVFVPDLKNEFITSLEANVNYLTSALRVWVAAYYTAFRDKTQVVNLYSDLYGRYTNTILQGLNSQYMGLELGVEVLLYGDLWIKAAGAFSNNRYTSNPMATTIYQTSGSVLGVEQLEYKDLRCSPVAQSVASVCLDYQPFGWNVSLSANFFADAYEQVSPVRYSPKAIAAAVDPIAFVTQERLPSGITLDIFGGRMFRLHNGSRIGVYAGVNNITNNRGIKTSGFQANRLFSDKGRYSAHASRFYHALGINGFLNVSFTF